MIEQETNNVAAMTAAEIIKSKYMVNHVEGGLLRWLIETAFVFYLLQAVIDWEPLLYTIP